MPPGRATSIAQQGGALGQIVVDFLIVAPGAIHHEVSALHAGGKESAAVEKNIIGRNAAGKRR